MKIENDNSTEKWTREIANVKAASQMFWLKQQQQQQPRFVLPVLKIDEKDIKVI